MRMRFNKKMKFFQLQECIPVGCVVPCTSRLLGAVSARRGVWPGVSAQGRSARGVSAQRVVSAQGGGVCPGGCLPGGGGGVCPGGLPKGGIWQTPPPVNRITDRCKNITLP